MKITGLNIDCLEAILDCLEFQDLLNAASSNKRINHAAKFVFIRKSNEKKIKFVIYEKNCGGKKYNFKVNSIIIRCRNIALQLLRCFGSLISHIYIGYEENFRNDYVTSYINQFCTESLIEIEFLNIPKGGLDSFKQPFIRIEKVRLHTSEEEHELGENSWINKIFPKMKQLEVYNTGKPSVLLKNGDVVNHFPCLECLKISNSEWYGLEYDRKTAKDVCSKNIMSILKLNSQLKKFILDNGSTGIFDVNLIECSKDSLQNLESLVLKVDSQEFFRNFNHKTVHLKSVKYLEIDFSNWPGRAAPERDLPFSFEQLETLIFQLKYFEYFFKFIEKYPTISTLGLDFNFCSQYQDWERLEKICPSITTINCFGSDSFEIDAISNMIAIFKSLKRITFTMKDARSRYVVLTSIKSIFNNEWFAFIHEMHYGLKWCRSGQYVTEYYVELKRRS